MSIVLPSQGYHKTELTSGNQVELSFGARRLPVQIYVGEQQARLIAVSSSLSSEMLLPLELHYKIGFFKKQIKIGPVIGICVAQKTANIDLNSTGLAKYGLLYGEIGGLLFLFAVDGVDTDKNTIKGFYYKSLPGNCWCPAVLPYPAVIFRRTGMPSRMTRHFEEVLPGGIFNSYYFDKWEAHEYLSNIPSLREYLPETYCYYDTSQLEEMFRKYRFVILKPRNGTMARGILKITYNNDSFLVEERCSKPKVVKGIASLEELLSAHMGAPYLIQQGLHLPQYEGRLNDYRLIMQKDETGSWVCTGAIGKFGKRGGIVSNYISAGYLLPATKALEKVFGLGTWQAFLLKEKMIALAKNICYQLDKNGHYADLGFDMVIDRNQRIWLLEINKRHDHSMPREFGDYNVYYQVKSNPILYASSRAGFNPIIV